jgi:PAS domain S-box-containing protein
MDVDLNYLWVSPASLNLLGVPPEALIGHNAFKFIHWDDCEMVRKDVDKLKSATRVHFNPFRFKNLKGEWRWIETRATNLIDDKAVRGIVCNSKDITENRNHILAIEEQNKKLMDIGWMQAHLVRSPLAKIMSLVDLLKNRAPDDDQDVLIEHLSKSAKELDKVITDITRNAICKTNDDI